MRIKRWAAALQLTLPLLLCSVSHAALIDRGGGMIYDTTLNVTWLSDMDFARTSGFDNDGRMSWQTATAWANDLVYGGFDDWRLPTIDPNDPSCTDTGQIGNIVFQHGSCSGTGGELSHLFVVDLGNRLGESVFNQTGDTAEQIANLALFSNIDVILWSGTDFAPTPSMAWLFSTQDGVQSWFSKTNPGGQALAVRTGDVAAATVPEPQGLALVLLGLCAAAVAGGRRKHRRGP